LFWRHELEIQDVYKRLHEELSGMRRPVAMARNTHFRIPVTSKLTFEILTIIGKVYFKLTDYDNY
jgi:hypothetical protein